MLRIITFDPHRRIANTLAVILLAGLCFASKHFMMPSAHPAGSYPAHDEHANEKVTVALDPYDTSQKASLFSVKYNEIGFMPIFVIVTNDSDQPISLAGSKAEFVTHDRSKISPATDDDIYRRISRPIGGVSQTPLPWPKKPKGSISKEAQDEVENSQFAARAVEPHSTQSGFMFFDVAGIDTPLSGASFYWTGLQDAKGNELMYFEVPLEKYLSAPK
jgi:hypothetical protein